MSQEHEMYELKQLIGKSMFYVFLNHDWDGDSFTVFLTKEEALNFIKEHMSKTSCTYRGTANPSDYHLIEGKRLSLESKE